MNVHLVIASFHENLRWLSRTSLPCPFTVMNSGSGGRWWDLSSSTLGAFHVSGEVVTTPCDNIGKEAGQYLQYILNNYDNLAERTVFVQADLGIRVHLQGINEVERTNRLLSALEHVATSEEPIGVFGGSLNPVEPKAVPFPSKDHRIFGSISLPSRPSHTLAGHSGAQFWVSRELIQKFPRSYYGEILDLGGMLAHELEYVWPAVFQPEVTPPQPEETTSDELA